MNKKTLWLMITLAALSLGLTACGDTLGSKALLFSNLSLSAGETGKVTLSASALPRFNSIQVGPKGVVKYDPKVIEVLSVTGMNGFVVFAHDIDSGVGEISLAAGSTSGPVPNGAILEFEVRAVGASGATSQINITQLDFVLKNDSEPITGIKITPGQVSIN